MFYALFFEETGHWESGCGKNQKEETDDKSLKCHYECNIFSSKKFCHKKNIYGTQCTAPDRNGKQTESWGSELRGGTYVHNCAL